MKLFEDARMLKLIGSAMLLIGVLGMFAVGSVIAANLDMHPLPGYMPRYWEALEWLAAITVAGYFLGLLGNRFDRWHFY